MKRIDAVVAGYLGLDLAPIFPAGAPAVPVGELLRPGRLVEVGGMDISLGGAVPNTGLAMQRFGRSVRLAGLVGEDGLGDLALGLLAKHGAAEGIRRTAAAPTAFGLVIAPPGADRAFLEAPGCNAEFSAENIDYDVVAGARIFHFGYPTLMRRFHEDRGEALAGMFARVRASGVATSLDTTLPDPQSTAGRADWRAILGRALPYVDVFLPSEEELVAMLAPGRYRKLAAAAGPGGGEPAIPAELIAEIGTEILSLGVKVLLVKAGNRGAYLRTGEVDGLAARSGLGLQPGQWDRRDEWIPAFPADQSRFVNACGAGDAAAAAFLSAMLEGRAAADCARLAMLAGRDSLYGPDALRGLREWETMVAEPAAAPE